MTRKEQLRYIQKVYKKSIEDDVRYVELDNSWLLLLIELLSKEEDV